MAEALSKVMVVMLLLKTTLVASRPPVVVTRPPEPVDVMSAPLRVAPVRVRVWPVALPLSKVIVAMLVNTTLEATREAVDATISLEPVPVMSAPFRVALLRVRVDVALFVRVDGYGGDGSEHDVGGIQVAQCRHQVVGAGAGDVGAV